MCVAHKLQYGINDGLSNAGRLLSNLLAKSRKIPGYFKHKALTTGELSQTWKALGKKDLKAVQVCPTRWNSSYFMLARLVELQDAIISPLPV